MNILGRLPAMFFAMIVVVAIGGCTVEKTEGDTTTFTFALWLPAVVFLGGVAAVPVGWTMRKRSSRWGWGFLILGPLAVIVFAPGLLLDKITVTPERFTTKGGIWFAPNYHEVQFDDLERMELIAETKQRRRKTTSYFLMCYKKDGSSAKVPVGDLMKQGAIVRILEAASAREVFVVDAK